MVESKSNYHRINIESQIRSEDSLFSYYKELIALRKSAKYQEVLTYGEIVPGSFEGYRAFRRSFRQGCHRIFQKRRWKEDSDRSKFWNGRGVPVVEKYTKDYCACF